MLLNRILKTLTNLLDTHQTDVRLQPIYSFVKRLENSGVRSKRLSFFLKRSFEISLSNSIFGSRIELLSAFYLLEKNLLKLEDAKALYEKIKSNFNHYIFC